MGPYYGGPKKKIRNTIGDHIENMWMHKINIVRKKNQRPRSISQGGASRLKFSDRNSIGKKMGTGLFFELACMPEGIENFDQ